MKVIENLLEKRKDELLKISKDYFDNKNYKDYFTNIEFLYLNKQWRILLKNKEIKKETFEEKNEIIVQCYKEKLNIGKIIGLEKYESESYHSYFYFNWGKSSSTNTKINEDFITFLIFYVIIST